jgi:UDP-N-acetylglucosamine 2-epimerase (non-hydrolysing)
MKHAIILGTRPEIIKLSSLIRLLQKNQSDFYIIHSNQHYSKEMDEVFFDELELPKPKYNMEVGSLDHNEMIEQIRTKTEAILASDKPDIIYVQGDTNTALAGALAGANLNIKVAHIEAGLRSYDKTMPEENNRITIDHKAAYLFAPTQKAADILKDEAIDETKIHVVGNTIVDAVYENLSIAKEKIDILTDLNLKTKEYFLLTLHRPSNVDEEKPFSNILEALSEIYIQYKLPIIFPVHPRTKKQLEKFEFVLPEGIKEIEPIGFLEMLQLEKNAKLILTDSGGIQEEACILQVPSVTLRFNTERPETLEVGASILAGTDKNQIIKATKDMIIKDTNWPNPFGDGKSAEKIIRIIEN